MLVTTVLLSTTLQVQKQSTGSLPGSGQKTHIDDYRHSPPYATDMFQKVRCKSELTTHMANYLCLHKSVPMKNLPNYTQEKLIHPCTLLLSRL